MVEPYSLYGTERDNLSVTAEIKIIAAMENRPDPLSYLDRRCKANKYVNRLNVMLSDRLGTAPVLWYQNDHIFGSVYSDDTILVPSFSNIPLCIRCKSEW